MPQLGQVEFQVLRAGDRVLQFPQIRQPADAIKFAALTKPNCRDYEVSTPVVRNGRTLPVPLRQLRAVERPKELLRIVGCWVKQGYQF